MKHDHLEELEARLREIRLADRDADLTDFLRVELQNATTQEEKAYIYSLLVTELQTHGRLLEAELSIRASLQIQPDKPDSWLTLAHHYFYYANQPEEALLAISTAVEKSRLDGNFVRQSNIDRIRIALDLGQYQLVEESLNELVNYEPGRDSLDVRLEDDFLSRIPPKMVSEELVEKYKSKLSTKS